MVNIGELGNVTTCEYPWRTIYLQYPERPANTTAAGPVTDIPLRRSHSLDYILPDLFRTQSAVTRTGAVNVNTQQQLGIQQRALSPLFLGVPVGTQNLSQTALDRIDNDPGSALAASVRVVEFFRARRRFQTTHRFGIFSVRRIGLCSESAREFLDESVRRIPFDGNIQRAQKQSDDDK